MALIAAQASQQGVGIANDVYGSKLGQDFFASGSITHKIMYAGLLGGTGYLIASFATSGGILGTVQNTQSALLNMSPIGWIANPFMNGGNIGDKLAGVKSKGFLWDNAGVIGATAGAITGLIIG